LVTETDNNSAAYDRIAERWVRERVLLERENTYFDRFAAMMPRGGSVLDLGCGAGVWARMFLDRGFRVTGVDASSEMLELARSRCPEAELIHADMTGVDLSGRFDGIVAWDSAFHLPRRLHAALYRSFHQWLEPGGTLLLSVGGSGGEFTAPMLGETFFYGAFEPEEAERMLREAGFTVRLREVDDPSSRGHVAVIATRD
jgi:cyclopropane fatty-acyl-phospholipid synthase-like methyltransferase